MKYSQRGTKKVTNKRYNSEREKRIREQKAQVKRQQKLMEGKGKPSNKYTSKVYRKAKEVQEKETGTELEPIFVLGEDDFWINPYFSDQKLDFMQELAEMMYYDNSEM